MITTTSELSSHCPSAPGATPANEAPIAPPMPARNAPTKNVMAKTTADVDAERSDHRLVVDAGADDHAHAGLVEPQPQQRADDAARRRA